MQINESETQSYNNIANLERAFIGGSLRSLPGQLEVQDLVYRYSDSTEYGWEEILMQKKKAMSAYALHPNAENVKKFEQNKADDPDDVIRPQKLLVMLWGVTRNLQVVPAAVRFITQGRKTQAGIRGVKEGVDLGYEEEIVIHSIGNGQPIPCKIDTGADMCSLHAEEIQVNGDTVTFVFNGRRYRMPMAGSQTVKQADSQQETRPTVRFDITLAGETVNGVEVNLNDRSGMSSPMLVGRNLLAKADFSINTLNTDDGMDESFTPEDWDSIATLFEDVEVPELAVKDDVDDKEIVQVIEALLSSDYTLRDVVRHIKRDSMKLVNEDIQY